MTIANIKAREAFTAKILSNRTTYPQLTATEAQNRLFGHLLKGTGYATYDDCKKILAELIYKKGWADGSAALDRFGVKNIDDLYLGMLNNFMSYVRMAIDYGLSPRDAWDVNSHNPKLRTRWLLFNGKSESLVECENYDQYLEKIMHDSCDDVSGIQSFETMYRNQKNVD